MPWPPTPAMKTFVTLSGMAPFLPWLTWMSERPQASIRRLT
jgi:hypothetical protein